MLWPPVIVYPPALNALPKVLRLGKCWKWQELHAIPVWRENAGTAADSEGENRISTKKESMAVKKEKSFLITPSPAEMTAP
jgi:hypothetical protein